jgi:hypothetical protein
MNVADLSELRGIVSESIRYWEARRILYNAALGVVAVGSLVFLHPSAGTVLNFAELAGLACMAMIANVLYCSAYAADIFFQVSEYRESWKGKRWMLLMAGILLAAGLFLLHD